MDTVETVYDALPSPPLPVFDFSPEDSGTSDSSRSSSQHSESPRNDWMLSGIAFSRDPKSFEDLDSFSMDWSTLDLSAHLSAFMSESPSVDPNTLHISGDSTFQFALSPPDIVPQPLQLPTPNAGSMSSRSASPVYDPSAGVNPSDLTLFAQLGQKARDAAGVVLAIPSEQPLVPISPVSPTSAPPSKVPIPRLRPINSVPVPPSKLLPDSVVAVTHPAPASVAPPSLAPPPLLEKPVRAKTSHTTIERRYRTNLNARILALRRAVPALRILEKNSSTQTQGRGLTGATAPMWDFNDVVNERGYVDGVKAAKKNSKGVVLGKAVEYIRALKRRETRLQREADGLRTLLSSLVGGPELLRKWECEWRARFGGDEADEVDEDEEDGDIELDGEDGVGEEESDEDDTRSKKRARTVKPPTPPMEKRKRGRPRKHPTPVPVPTVPVIPTIVPATPAPASVPIPASKPLLALALIFNLFHPDSPPVGRTGAVLTPVPESQASGWSIILILHTLVYLLLLISLVKAYLPRRFSSLVPSAYPFAPSPPAQVFVSKGSSPIRSERMLRAAMGAKGGVSGVFRVVLTRILRLRMHGDLRVWRRVGEIDVLRGSAAPLLSRVQTYLALGAQPSRAPVDNIILALLARAFAPSSAAAHWADARRADNSTVAEKLVLDMDVNDAAQILATAYSSPISSSGSNSSNTSDSEAEDDYGYSPVHLIATHAVLARVKLLAANMFVATVTGVASNVLDDAMVLHAAGRELGGDIVILTRLLERVARCIPGEALPMLEADGSRDESPDTGVVYALMYATVLFRRAFPTGVSIPLASREKSALYLTLRRVLANPAFETNTETEEARDRVVDMLAEVRRS